MTEFFATLAFLGIGLTTIRSLDGFQKKDGRGP